MDAGEGCAAQEYNLKWTNHTNNILEMFSEQLLNGLLVDVTLFCDGQYIRAHKMVLSACSPYFQELFKVHKVDHPVIFMNGVRYVAVKQMVEFMYQGEIKVSDEDLDQLLTIAESLQIKGLCKIRRDNEDMASGSPKKDAYMDEPNVTPVPAATPKRRKRRKLSHSPASAFDVQTNGADYGGANTLESIEDAITPITVNKVQPRRPKNAFMIFAGEWRKKLAKQHQGDTNKEISMRLGAMWKGFSVSEKDEYYLKAKKVVEDHRLKYPDYHLAKEAKRRTKNPGVKRKRNNKLVPEEDIHNSTGSTGPADTTNEGDTPNNTTENENIDIKLEPDENNLVIAESQGSESS